MMTLKPLALLGLLVPSLAAPTLAQLPSLNYTQSPTPGDFIHSLSLPGFRFRRAKPLTSIPIDRRVQNYADLRRVPHDVRKPRRSAATLFGQVQRSSGGKGYENVTAINHYAAEYAVQATFNGRQMDVVIDSGSADTWVIGSNFSCKGSLNETVSDDLCALGPAFAGNFTGGPLPNMHFAIKYGDGESVQGLLGKMDVEFAGVTVFDQEIAIASQGTWHGNNVTSGILGLAYPSLTNAYWGDDIYDNSQFLSVPYSPLFTSMVTSGLAAPYWTIAIARNSSLGSVSIGGMPPVDISKSDHDQTPIIIADMIDRDSTSWKPSFYTIVPTAFRFGGITTSGHYPFILDTATSLIYLPPDLAEIVNGKFDPPASYLWNYGAYFTSCDAIPPSFGVQIGGTTFWVNPKDLLNKEERDPLTNLCQTGIGNGGTGPYILGITFLTNVVAMMNIGSGNIEFWSHQFY
ncbi:acid protease [Daldinia loculata]|uniref:acid protease n=1 Tax=Daldinia loculata TaxID=103429 RepID=UPI0020C5A69C|nr:acid protease [Daldinia loculata]KAI1641962.1 acid protease [Daldinia loculata]